VNNVTVLINSYFPQDPKTQQVDEAELTATLECIRNIIENNESSTFLWAGDINTDFMRNTGQTIRMNNYLLEIGLIKSWDKFELDFTCHHEINEVSYVLSITSSGMKQWMTVLTVGYWRHPLESIICLYSS
jgi:hypothetical protein